MDSTERMLTTVKHFGSPQVRLLAKELATGRSISRREADNELRIASLSRRIIDLKDILRNFNLPIRIRHERHRDKTSRSYVRYKLVVLR